MANNTYVKTIKFDADTTKVLNEVAKLNVVVNKTSKQFAKGFFSPELKKSLSDFKDGLLDALDVTKSPEMRELRDTFKTLLDEKSQLTSMQTQLQTQMKDKEGTQEWFKLNDALTQINEKLEEVNDQLFDTEDNINIQKEKEAKAFAGNVGKYAGKQVVKVFENIGKTISKFLTDMFTEALQKLEEIASYDLANTTRFSQDALDLATQYGLVGAQAYGTQKAAEQMGYGSVDTLVENLWNMNDAQREEFNKLQSMYEKSYEQDKELATAYQKYLQEWNDFKESFQNELLEWFSSHKDEIKQVLSMLMDFMKFVMQILSAIANAFGGAVERSDSQRTAAATDIINSYRNNTNNNVNVSNTFNVQGGKLETNNELAKAGSSTYRQIIEAFK